jgi:hypothetical protein
MTVSCEAIEVNRRYRRWGKSGEYSVHPVEKLRHPPASAAFSTL